eukprot:evm.model.scf_2042.2 EVM.evm.TU.scf_2042.2   scf_2042:21424-24489(+)
MQSAKLRCLWGAVSGLRLGSPPPTTTPLARFCSSSIEVPAWLNERKDQGFGGLLSVLQERLSTYGAQKPVCWDLLFSEAKSEDDAQQALKALEIDRGCRRSSEQHQPYPVHVGAAIMKALVHVDAIDLGMTTVGRLYELGIPPSSEVFAPLMQRCFGESPDLARAGELIRWMEGYDVAPSGALLESIESRADDLMVQQKISIWKAKQGGF